MNLIFWVLLLGWYGTASSGVVLVADEVEYRVRLEDPARGLVSVAATFQLVRMPARLILEDRGTRFFSADRGLPALSRTARPEATEPVFTTAAGDALDSEALEDGRWAIQTAGHRTVRVHRTLVVPDRTGGDIAHHPFASTLSTSSAVLLGRDLFLAPSKEHTYLGAPVIQVHLESADGWQMRSPFGRGTRFQAPGFRALQEEFLVAGPDLAIRALPTGRAQVTVVAARQDFDRPGLMLSRSADLVAEAVATFGALPPGPYLVVLQPLRQTAHRRVLSQRGASTSHTVVAYVDTGSSTAYAEHPLSVVGHETAHWWNPRAMHFEGGVHAPWFTEGITTYYEWLLLLRTGAIDLDYFVQAMTDLWERDRTMPAATRWNLERASARFQRDSGAQQVIYRRGGLLGFLLDVRLRQQGSSLDQLMQRLLDRGRRRPGSMRPEAILKEVRELGGDAVLEDLRGWLAAEAPPDVTVGLEFLGYDLEMRAAPLLGLGLAAEDVPVVSSVHPRGPVTGKLRVGDVIIGMDEVAVASVVEFREALDSWVPGQEVVVRVLRGDGEAEVSVTVGTRRSPTVVPQEGSEAQNEAREELRHRRRS